MLQVPILLNSNKDESPVVRVPKGTWALGFHGEVESNQIQLLIDGNPVTAQDITFEGPCDLKIHIRRNNSRTKFTIYAKLVSKE